MVVYSICCSVQPMAKIWIDNSSTGRLPTLYVRAVAVEFQPLSKLITPRTKYWVICLRLYEWSQWIRYIFAVTKHVFDSCRLVQEILFVLRCGVWRIIRYREYKRAVTFVSSISWTNSQLIADLARLSESSPSTFDNSIKTSKRELLSLLGRYEKEHLLYFESRTG